MAIIVGANIVGENVFSLSTLKAVGPKAVEENQRPCCGCYQADSTDARCCGVCYCCCPAKQSACQ